MKTMYTHVSILQQEVDKVHTKLDLVLGALALLLDRKQPSSLASATADASFLTPPHQIGLRFEPPSANEMNTIEKAVAEQACCIPTFPFASPSLSGPLVDGCKCCVGDPAVNEISTTSDDNINLDGKAGITTLEPHQLSFADRRQVFCSSTIYNGTGKPCAASPKVSNSMVVIDKASQDVGKLENSNPLESSQPSDKLGGCSDGITDDSSLDGNPTNPNIGCEESGDHRHFGESSLKTNVVDHDVITLATPLDDVEGFLDNVSSDSCSASSTSDLEPQFDDPQVQAEYTAFLHAFVQGNQLTDM